MLLKAHEEFIPLLNYVILTWSISQHMHNLRFMII